MHFTSINKNSSVPTIEILIEKLAVEKEDEPVTQPGTENSSNSESSETTDSGENSESNGLY